MLEMKLHLKHNTYKPLKINDIHRYPLENWWQCNYQLEESSFRINSAIGIKSKVPKIMTIEKDNSDGYVHAIDSKTKIEMKIKVNFWLKFTLIISNL